MIFGTKHTLDTDNPQSYFEHGWFALKNSSKILVYAIAGIVHAFLPEIKCLQFYTSTGVIKLYKELEDSRRHDKEIEKIFDIDRIMYIKRFDWVDNE